MPHDKPREGKLCDCTSQYCKHYKSDYDKFVEDANKQPQPSGEGWVEERMSKFWQDRESGMMITEPLKNLQELHDELGTNEDMMRFVPVVMESVRKLVHSLVSEAEARARDEAFTKVLFLEGDLSMMEFKSKVLDILLPPSDK